MKRKSTRTKGIKRKITILLSIALLFTLAFTGTALAEEVTAYESVNYVELEELLESGSPGDTMPNWDHGSQGHINLIRRGNTSGISATNVQLLEAGMMLPDGRNRFNQDMVCAAVAGCRELAGLRSPVYRGFHGYHTSRQNNNFAESNYVAAYSLITMIANQSGSTANLINPGLTGGTGGELFNIRNRFRRIDGVTPAEGIRITCRLGHEIFRNWAWLMQQNGFSNTVNNRRFFIWGMALHALSDAFDHSTLGRVSVSPSLWQMTHVNSSNATARYNAAQAAVNAALRRIVNGGNGCCCQFLAAAGHFTTTNFRMANLTRYANQTSIAVPHRGALTSAERRSLGRGDILFPVNINSLTYPGTRSYFCSRCHTLTTAPQPPCSC